MQKFTIHTGIVAPLNIINIDTDMIIPKQFLKTIKRTGLGANLFDEMRFTPEGKEIPGFILNREGYRGASIIVAGENFGCGSSREHAPWALLDYGVRVIIAPSFADIFYNNCFKNGILPLVLAADQVEHLMQYAMEKPREITVNLEKQEVETALGNFTFEIDPFRKYCLINGLDDIGLTLEKQKFIDAFENNLRVTQPWSFEKHS